MSLTPSRNASPDVTQGNWMTSPSLEGAKAPMPKNFTFQLDQFEGPLDLLLYLIQSHELDINRVSLSKVTDQYLGMIKLMHEMNFDLASEFLVMAATLILIKSRSLMPKEEEQNTEALLEAPVSEDDILRQLLERQRYLDVAKRLEKSTFLDWDVFNRPNKRPPVEKVWREMNQSVLATTFQDLLIREQRRARVVMKKETVSLAEKIQEFGTTLPVNQPTALFDLIRDKKVRGEWVVSFLASLELSRLKKLKIYQEKTFDPIFIELLERLIDFDARQASGFDYLRSEKE